MTVFFFGIVALELERSGGKTAEEGFIKIDLRSYNLSDLNAAERKALQARPRIDFSSIFDTVSVFFSSFWTIVIDVDQGNPHFLSSHCFEFDAYMPQNLCRFCILCCA